MEFGQQRSRRPEQLATNDLDGSIAPRTVSEDEVVRKLGRFAEEPNQLLLEMRATVGYPLLYGTKRGGPLDERVGDGLGVRLSCWNQPDVPTVVVLEDEDLGKVVLTRHYEAEVEMQKQVRLDSVQRVSQRTRYDASTLGGDAVDAGMHERLDIFREILPPEVGFHRRFGGSPAAMTTYSGVSGDESSAGTQTTSRLSSQPVFLSSNLGGGVSLLVR